MPSDVTMEIEASLRLTRAVGLRGNLYCRVILSHAQQTFITPLARNGNWNKTFSFKYSSGEDIMFEVFEQGWFGWKYLIGCTSLSLSPVPKTCHSTLRCGLSSSAYLLIHLKQNIRSRYAPPDIALYDKSGDVLEYSYSAMQEYLQKKLHAHKETLEMIAVDMPNDGADADLKQVLEEVEFSLHKCFDMSNVESLKHTLDNMSPSRNELVETEINFWNSLFNLSRSEPVLTQTTPEQTPNVTQATSPIPASDVAILYEERLKSLQKELELERTHVQILQKRNTELETEVERKTTELVRIKETDAVRDKVVHESELSRLELFEEKLRQIDVEKQKLVECERNLFAREKELDKREQQISKAIQDLRTPKDGVLRNVRDKDPASSALFLDNMLNTSNFNHLEHHLSSISHRLSKLDQLDDVIISIKSMSSNRSGSGEQQSKRSLAEIKADLEKLELIICGDSSDQKEKDAANIKYERVFIELTTNEEHKQEIKRLQDEKARINEPLNREALKTMLQEYKEKGDNPELQSRKRQYQALTLIGMDRDSILGKHQNDFNQYLLGDLSLTELRAIRASLPIFRRDQKKQHEFMEALELKIDELAKKPAKQQQQPPKAKKIFPTKPLTVPNGAAGGANISRSSSAPMNMGNLFAEIEKRKNMQAQNE